MWLGPILAVTAYFLGSVSFAELVARRAGVDIRAAGSGNPGATNVGRVVGKRAGRVVLVLDVLKGLLPTGAAVLFASPGGALGGLVPLGAPLGSEWVAATGVAATAGHCFPIWHRFDGGKGAATAAGAMLAAVPIAGTVAVLLYLLLKRITRRASVGSLTGAVGSALTTLLVTSDAALWAMAAGIVVLVFARHHDNLRRLAEGTEPES